MEFNNKLKNKTILLRIEPETKLKLLQVAKQQRRSMTSLILFLIDKKIQESEKKVAKE